MKLTVGLPGSMKTHQLVSTFDQIKMRSHSCSCAPSCSCFNLRDTELTIIQNEPAVSTETREEDNDMIRPADQSVHGTREGFRKSYYFSSFQ